jgi:methylenetetrahydrofolate--tRNA-(uracil-5-)-methyltransferase
LHDVKPEHTTEVHSDSRLAEIVCSNSLGSIKEDGAPGILKDELQILGCKLLEIAWKNRVPAGHSLSVNREGFAQTVTTEIDEHPNITRVCGEVTTWPKTPAIIATGPVTTPKFQRCISEKTGDDLYFYDAVSPVVSADSIDQTKGSFGARYDENNDDYFNIPFTREQYDHLVNEILSADVVPLSDFDKNVFFDGCLPVEEILRRGRESLRFGPMKPVGLEHLTEDHRAWAVLQLRRETTAADAFNLVGFQTRMKHGEQKRILQLIPGFENVEIQRYGLIHRNFYFYAPKHLNKDLSMKSDPQVYFAGQMTGVEGYMESIMTGFFAAHMLIRKLENKQLLVPGINTMCGALLNYVTNTITSMQRFKPMNANFSVAPLDTKLHKKERRGHYQKLALKAMEEFKIMAEI